MIIRIWELTLWGAKRSDGRRDRMYSVKSSDLFPLLNKVQKVRECASAAGWEAPFYTLKSETIIENLLEN